MSGTEGPFPFEPDWVIAPALTLQEWLETMNLSVSTLPVATAGRARRDEVAPMIRAVLDRKELTGDHAQVLEAGTGVPARFWLALEHNYRSGLAAGLTDASDT